MADITISALTPLGAAPAIGDELVLVDISDTTQSAQGSTKNMTVANLFTAPSINAPVLLNPTVTGTLSVSGTITSGGDITAGGHLNVLGTLGYAIGDVPFRRRINATGPEDFALVGDSNATANLTVLDCHVLGVLFVPSFSPTTFTSTGLVTAASLKVVGNVGFYNTTPQARQSIVATGHLTDGNALLALLTALQLYGLITFT